MIGSQNMVVPVRNGDDDIKPTGRFTRIDGELYYAIQDYDRLDPFLMSVVSDSDHWMYLSSNGGLTAGRGNPDRALFPYDPEDKIHQCHGHTGPHTALWVRYPDGQETFWEPFTQSASDHYRVRRHLYKSEVGNAVIFEEVNQDLEMAFRYRWCFSEAFGFVRRATLANAGEDGVSVTMLDGLLNVQPYGITAQMHQMRHCLADAYKHCQVDAETGLGIFALSSMITDRPEPGETMHATSVWSHGLPSPGVIFHADQLGAFRRGEPLVHEPILKGRKGAYLLHTSIKIGPGQLQHWHIVADVAQDQQRIVRLRKQLRDGAGLVKALHADCRTGDVNLRRNVASADGMQATGSPIMTAHHFANVLFNNMRGGVFDRNYDVSRDDLKRFVAARNTGVSGKHADFLGGLDSILPAGELLNRAEAVGDPDLTRLCYEYLPIYFSRRHGDPSRPWNLFDIRLKNARGNRLLAYQGNWRDIFQNWEALCLSFPGFLPGIIAKFLNASTADGFNPYRITNDGIDWEVPDEDDPWSNIGYWGDHQIIYLLKLLESANAHYPGELDGLMDREVFSYADVPYTIKPYEQILKNPHDTIVYDKARAKRVAERVRATGADGRLLADGDGGVFHVSLAEKLIVPALSKLSNLVVDGGIWLNTQRPEWNDANNALVGHGLSMVTLYYLRRYLAFCGGLFGKVEGETLRISSGVVEWLEGVLRVLESERGILKNETIGDVDRKRLLDALGMAFGEYRQSLYAQGLAGKTDVPCDRIVKLIDLAAEYVDHSIRANRRTDGLYHAYNLMDLSATGDAVSVRHLYEMLEGQVAALSSGVLTTQEVLGVLEALPKSALYRPDQDSYVLYPDRQLPGFLEKNIVPVDRVEASVLLRKLTERGDGRVILKDDDGRYRFGSCIHNVGQLSAELETLAHEPGMRELIEKEGGAIKDLFESVYNHKAFTGRSGGMYGYEGLGCIYWHMVAKLLLAVQECHARAVENGADAATVDALIKAYYRVRAGLGFNKSPLQYGAFPTDPYSHTPGFAGARQPGMTGQVKEEILTRRLELGVVIRDGCIRFAPDLLREEEFLKIESRFHYYGVDGEDHTIELTPGAIAFMICQVPVVYRLVDGVASISVTDRGGAVTEIPGDTLPPEVSADIFARSGRIARVDVVIPRDRIVQ